MAQFAFVRHMVVIDIGQCVIVGLGLIYIVAIDLGHGVTVGINSVHDDFRYCTW